MVPLAAALAGPAESAFGRAAALWGCAALCVGATAAVLCVRDVRTLTRHTVPVALARPDAEPETGPTAVTAAEPESDARAPVPADTGSADAEGSVRRLG
jgi:hypothetical protein